MVPSGEREREINALSRSILKSMRILLLISGVYWGKTESWTEQDSSSLAESKRHLAGESQGTTSKIGTGEYLPSLQKIQSLHHMYQKMTHVSVKRGKRWLIWGPCQQCTHLSSSLCSCSRL